MKIAVLGSGLMGRVLSMRLYQSVYTDITLIDRDNMDGKLSPAYIAGGMIAPYSESVMGGKTIYDLGKNSLSLWKKYLDNLQTPKLYNDNGTLLLASPNFSNEIKHYINKINFNTNENNYYQVLTQSDICDLEPELKYTEAYYLPSEGVVNARDTMSSIAKFLTNHIKLEVNTEINCTEASNEIMINGMKQKFDLVIDCRGFGSREILPGLRGIRGEIIRVFAPEVNILRPVRLFHPRHSIYISI
jgi:glycine oxidase